MMRALPFDFRTDLKVCPVFKQYTFGYVFLVSPVVVPGATSRKVYLPEGASWTNFWIGTTVLGGQGMNAPAPLSKIPLSTRAGAVLPLGPLVQYAGEKPAAPIELRVYRGADDAFTLYEDERYNYDYEKATMRKFRSTGTMPARLLLMEIARGTFLDVNQRIFYVVWAEPHHSVELQRVQNPDAEIAYDGQSISV